MNKLKIPLWIKEEIPRKNKLPANIGYEYTGRIISKLKLNTVCQSAKCPNIGTCFKEKTATFMILGPRCTRNCGFCGVEKGQPEKVDFDEPLKIVEASKMLGLKHIVITSVTRDDLSDGGAGHFAETVNLLRKEIPGATVEVLTPDFKGDLKALEIVIEAEPDIFNHNIETIPRLYEKVRPQASYKTSLNILKYVKEISEDIYTKSGLMLGLSENINEIISSLKDLKENKCDFITIGQYFKPSKESLPVVEYISKDVFVDLEQKAKEMGFLGVFSGTWVRSSFQAERMLKKLY